MQLNPLDKWTIARACVGHAIPNPLQAGHSEDGAKLLTSLRPYSSNWKDATQAARMLIPPAIMKAISAIDTETPPPTTSSPTGSPAGRPWHILNAAELANLPAQLWLVPGEIPAQGITVLYGESGSGKSFLSLDYALRLAQTMPIVYIPTEGVAGYQKRVAAWCSYHQRHTAGLSFLVGDISLMDAATFAALIDDLRGLRPALVIVDTLAMAMVGGDENSTRDMGLLLKACRTMTRELNAAVMLVHHVNKAGVTERGSGALRGNADSMIKVSPADDLILVECTKTKDEAAFKPRFYHMRPTGESIVLVPAETHAPKNTDPLTNQQRKVLEMLALEVNTDGASIRELAEAGQMSLSTIWRTLSTMAKLEYVEKVKSGSYAITLLGSAKLERAQAQGVSSVSSKK